MARRLVPGALALLLAAGCSLVRGYPDIPEESGFAACHDGVDNDGDGPLDCDDASCASQCDEICVVDAEVPSDEDQDGTVDCDDLDCLGLCPERTLDQCSDGQDDDGDGQTDWADAGCWAFADVEVRSCSSVPATTRVYDFFGELWAHLPGALRPDPTGRFAHDVLVFDPNELGAEAVLDGDIPGATVGTRATFDVFVHPREGGLNLELTVEDEPLDVGTMSISMQPGRVWVAAEDPSGSYFPENIGWDGEVAQWVRFVLEITAEDTIQVEIYDGDALFATIVNARNGRLRDAHRLGIRLGSRRPAPTSGPVIVGEIRVERPGLDPCGYASPATSRTDRAQTFGTYGAARLGGRLCVGGFEDEGALPSALAYSDDDGHTFRVVDLEGVGWVHGMFARGETINLVLDGAEGSYWAVTRDCESVFDVTPVPFSGNRIWGYAFDGTLHHVVTNGTFAEPFATGIAYSVLEPDGTMVEERRIESWAPRFGSATFHGDDLILAAADFGAFDQDQEVSVLGLDPGAPPEPELLFVLPPSQRAGACDERFTERSVLAIDPSPTVEGAALTGTFVSTCPVPVGGIITRSLVVRAP